MSTSEGYSDFCKKHHCDKQGCYLERTGFLTGFGNVAIAAQELLEQTNPEDALVADNIAPNTDSPDLHKLVRGVDDVYRQLLATCHNYSLVDQQNRDIDSL